MSSSRLGLSYFGNRHFDHALQDLRVIASAGVTIVDHVMSEEDLRWYQGTIEQLVSASKQIGLEVWLTPWAVGGVFGGEAASYAVMEHPEACQIDSVGRQLPALCFNQEPFRELMVAWLDAASASGADVVTWDEPHIGPPGSGARTETFACYCQVCQQLFLQQFRGAMPRTWTDEIAVFNGSTIARTIEWLVAEANTRGLRSGIIVLPDENLGDRGWRELAELGGVAYFGATPYWMFQGVDPEEIEPYLRRWCRRIVSATSGQDVNSLAWIQAFSVPTGRESEIQRGFEIMMEEGVEVIAAWGYRACDMMSALAPDRPAETWAAVLRGFEEVSGT